jgi:3D (Asp-Asp-Asp) domain-containing protein
VSGADEGVRPSHPTPRTTERVRVRRRRRMAAGTTALIILGGAAVAGLQLAWGVEPAAPASHLPVVVYATPMIDPVMVRARKKLDPVKVAEATKKPTRKPFERLADRVPVQFTQYCLQGRTRRDNWVREGIVAADPRVFPLGSYVELFVSGKYLGRFLVDDTGGVIKGNIIDIWVPSCKDAIRFGRRRGHAVLVGREERKKKTPRIKVQKDSAGS